jgi:hypothetical protein
MEDVERWEILARIIPHDYENPLLFYQRVLQSIT